MRHAEQPRLHVFIATSAIHMKKKLRMTEDQVKAEAAAGVARAKSYCDDVEFSPEDASRSEVDFMCEVSQLAVDNGATTLNIPDTVGFGMPEEFGELITYVLDARARRLHRLHPLSRRPRPRGGQLARGRQGRSRDKSSARSTGWGSVRATPRSKRSSWRSRPAATSSSALDTRVRTEELARTSRIVARLTGYPVQYNKAVVGRNAFAHEAGIHQHGVLEDRETYEIIDAGTVGQQAAQIVLGKHSGRHAFADTLAKMGIKVQGDALNAAFTRFKELSDRKVEITEADLEAIVVEELGTSLVHRFSMVSLDVHGGTLATPSATVVLNDSESGTKVDATGAGNGMIDAVIAAIGRGHRRVGHRDRLQGVVGDRRRRRAR